MNVVGRRSDEAGCRECWRKYQREYQRGYRRRRDPEKLRESQRKANLKRLYGVSPDDYDRMFEEQGGVCRICRQPEQRHRTDGSRKHLHFDHDHVTGQVRGLLCTRCNTVLGMANDDRSVLASAIDYLSEFA